MREDPPSLAWDRDKSSVASASAISMSVAGPLPSRAVERDLEEKSGILRWGPWIASGVTLALGLWQISRLSYSQDEAATLSAVRRPLGSMLAVLGHIDAVHGSYYLLMHLVVKLGASEAVLRMPSVLAMTIAAWLTTALGRKLAGAWPGLAAGLLFAVSALTTEYAHDARPFAMVTCLAVLASYRFVSFVETGTRRDAAWYGAAMAGCGLMNVFGLLLIAAHTATLVASQLRKDRLHRFAYAAGAATLAVSPIAWLAATEVGQVGWERGPGAAVAFAVVAVLAVAGILAWTTARSPDKQPSVTLGTAPLVRLSAPWLIIPVALLVTASQIPIASAPGASLAASTASGIWEPRYLLFCLPALTLFVVALISRLLAKPATFLTAAVIAASLAAQPLARPATSPNDIRDVSALLQAKSRPGDAVVFPNVAKRLIKDAYPVGFSHLRDVGLNTSPPARDSLYGLNVSSPILWRRLAGTRRVWMVIFPVPRPGKYYGSASEPHAFCLQSSWQFPLNMVLLYRRC
jgi:mannosyltransferase